MVQYYRRTTIADRVVAFVERHPWLIIVALFIGAILSGEKI